MRPIETVAEMPPPPELPLYVSVERAAKLLGLSYETVSAWANAAVDPLPHISVGRSKKLVRVAALPAYARRKESV